MKSKCHNAEMRVEGDTTNYYVCTVCEKACDEMSDNSGRLETNTIEEMVREFDKYIGAVSKELVSGKDFAIGFKEEIQQALTKAKEQGAQETLEKLRTSIEAEALSCSKKIDEAREQGAREEREQIAEWVEDMNTPTANVMAVAVRNEIILILKSLKQGNDEALTPQE